VIGEVQRPGSFIVPTEKFNIVQSLGMAGDMTAFGRRDNVLVIREKDGKRTMARIDLNVKDAFNSPYFYLQQNDIIYVTPYQLKRRATSDTKGWITFSMSIITFLT